MRKINDGLTKEERWRQRNPAAYRLSQAAYGPKRYQRKREFLTALKDRPCLDCKRRYPPYVMQFDHVRGKKLFTIGRQVASRSWEALRCEVKKCEVVCANCHAERTHGSRS